MLKSLPQVTPSSFLDRVVEITTASSKGTRQERRDGQLGRIFAVLVMCRADAFKALSASKGEWQWLCGAAPLRI